MTYFAWIVLAFLALGQTSAGVTPKPAVPQGQVLGAHVGPPPDFHGKTFVAIGDSISAGKYAVTADRTFPARISQQLGMSLVLIAHSGAKAAWALPYLAQAQAAHPALVTIELGTNDMGFHTPIDQFAQQYETIVSAVSQPGTLVLCIGSWLPGPSYDAVISATCDRHGGTFVSLDGFYAVNAFHAGDGHPTYLGVSDWFHPGDEGHAAIAAAVVLALPGHQTASRPALAS